MPKVVLDTNFIINCVENSVDFSEELEERGFEILVPKEVLEELKRIVQSKKKKHFREIAELCLKIINKEELEIIELGIKGRHYVDRGLVNFLKKNPRFFLATMDKELKKKIPNSKVVLRAKKKLEIV